MTAPKIITVFCSFLRQQTQSLADFSFTCCKNCPVIPGRSLYLIMKSLWMHQKWAHVLCTQSKFSASVPVLNACLLHCSAAPFVYILELLQMKEEPAPPSSWFRHVGKLAFLAAGPKHQNNGSSCVITPHTGEGCFNPLLSSRKQNTC